MDFREFLKIATAGVTAPVGFDAYCGSGEKEPSYV